MLSEHLKNDAFTNWNRFSCSERVGIGRTTLPIDNALYHRRYTVDISNKSSSWLFHGGRDTLPLHSSILLPSIYLSFFLFFLFVFCFDFFLIFFFFRFCCVWFVVRVKWRRTGARAGDPALFILIESKESIYWLCEPPFWLCTVQHVPFNNHL